MIRKVSLNVFRLALYRGQIRAAAMCHDPRYVAPIDYDKSPIYGSLVFGLFDYAPVITTASHERTLA